MDFEDLIKLVGFIAWIGWSLFSRFLKPKENGEGAEPARPKKPKPAPRPVIAKAPTPMPAARFPVGGAASAGLSQAQSRLISEVEKIEAEARALGEANRHAVSTRRFTELLTEWLPARGAELRKDIAAGGPHLTREHIARFQWLSMVRTEVEEQLRQRKDPALLPMLGDADALAEACYRPIVQFAESADLPLAAAHPVVRLSEVDLSIWTGFAPTSIAPIFLPQDFFNRLAWWPAVTHEIGHSFLVSVQGLRDRLGEELELPSEEVGAFPLTLSADGGLSQSELWRVHGVWFEELFCDVFGTLMCGPAYGLTMIELFAAKEDPREVLVVPPEGPGGRYGVHPPRHLRVHVVAWVLEMAGFSRDAKALLSAWHQRCGLPEDGPEGQTDTPLLFWTHAGYIYVPWAAVRPYTQQLVESLYRGPLHSLKGHGLRDVPGLDYGPNLHSQAQRAKAQLLNGQVPSVRDARAVISGAVLAWVERPELEPQLLQRARGAIAAVGTFERAPDVFDRNAGGFAEATVAVKGASRTGVVEISPDAVADALLLREILERPKAMQRGARR